jgi:hypothetical protein
VPWGMWQRRSPPEQGGRIRSRGTRGSAGALSSRKAGFGDAGHVPALEPFQVGRYDLEPWDTWQHRSPLELRGRIQTRETCDNTEALPCKEAGSRAVDHVAAPELY